MSDYSFERKFKYDKNKNLDLKLVELQKQFFICLQDDTREHLNKRSEFVS